MSNRGLSASAISELQANPVRFFNLIRIDFATPLYYTDAPYNITYDDDDGSQTYVSSANFSNFPDIPEKQGVAPSTMDLTLTGTLANHALGLTQDFRNVPVYVHHYINGVGEGTNKFLGYIDTFEASEVSGKGKSWIKFKVDNNWSNWDAKNGRYISSVSQDRVFPGDGDEFFEFAGVTDIVEDYWGGARGFGNKTDAEIYSYMRAADIHVSPLALYFSNARGQPLAFDSIYNFEKRTAQTTKLPVGYGKCVTPGVPVFKIVTGTKLEYLWIVYALSEGECDSLYDNKIEIDGVAYDDAQFNSKIKYAFYSGPDAQTESDAETEGSGSVCDASDLRAASTLWDGKNRDGKGVCYCIVRYEFDKTVFDAIPKPIFFLKGKKLIDPNNTGNPAAWSANPAWIGRDYISDSRYGKGISTSLLSGFDSAATYAATTNTDHDEGEGGTAASIALFEFNGMIDTDQEITKNLASILFSMRGDLAWVNGVHKLVINRHDTTIADSVYSFTEVLIDKDRPFDYKGAPLSSLLNLVEYEYINRDIGHTPVLVYANSATYLSKDNSVELRKKITNKFETNGYRAQNRATTILKESRNQIAIAFAPARADALLIECGDIIDITRSTQGWSAKLFRVTNMLILASGWVMITGAREFVAASYDWAISAEVAFPTDSGLLDPFDTSTTIQPASVTLATGTQRESADGTTLDRLKITVELPSGSAYLTEIEVQVQETNDGSTEWETIARLDPDGDLVTYHDAIVGVTYTARARGINSLGKVSSWKTSSDHTLTGSANLGADVYLQGTNDWSRSSFYYEDFFASLDNFYTQNNITIDTTAGVVLKDGVTGSGLAVLKRYIDTTLYPLPFDNDWRWKCWLRIDGASNLPNLAYGYCAIIAAYAAGDGIIEFKMGWDSSGSKLRGQFTCNDAATNEVTEYDGWTNQPCQWNDGDDIEIEIYYDYSAGEMTCTVTDGTTIWVATHSTYLPDGTTGANQIGSWTLGADGSATGDVTMTISSMIVMKRN